MYICMYEYMYVCMYVCMYVYTLLEKFSRHNRAGGPLGISDVSEALMYDALKSVLGLPAPLLKEKTMILSDQMKMK